MQLMKRMEHWDPFRDLEELGSRFGRLFRWAGNGEQEGLGLADWSPPLNVVETEKAYLIRAELPEVKKEDVVVTLERGVLTIEGERKEEKEEKGKKFLRREINYGKFVRRFTVPEDADEAKIEAVYKDGLLEVTIARSEAKAPAVHRVAIH